jgi:hypothetical protein
MNIRLGAGCGLHPFFFARFRIKKRVNLNGHGIPLGRWTQQQKQCETIGGGSCARADNPTVAWAKVSRVTVARRRLRVSVLAELPK